MSGGAWTSVAALVALRRELASVCLPGSLTQREVGGCGSPQLTSLTAVGTGQVLTSPCGPWSLTGPGGLWDLPSRLSGRATEGRSGPGWGSMGCGHGHLPPQGRVPRRRGRLWKLCRRPSAGPDLRGWSWEGLSLLDDPVSFKCPSEPQAHLSGRS